MTKKTAIVRVPKDVLEGLERVMPKSEGWDNGTRFRILWKSSAVNIEDFLNGRKTKKK